MGKILSLINNERGAEMVEWLVVGVVLAVGTFLMLGPGGVLHQAIVAGLQVVANIVS